MQNAGLAALGLNWRYLAFEVRPEDLPAALAGAARLGFVGLNLTVPHKLLAFSLVEELDASAREWGAVNTVLFEGLGSDGSWRRLWELPGAPERVRSRGFNTDADAISRAIREELKVELRGARVLMLGAGGAGRAAALKLAAEGGSTLWLVNRTQGKADDLAKEIRAKFAGVETAVGYPTGKIDLVVNGTSLGLKPGDALPLDTARFPLSNAGAVYDMIYRPARTPLLDAAAKAGCRTANGLGMLLHQGTRALEIWTGQAAPVAEMRKALEGAVYA